MTKMAAMPIYERSFKVSVFVLFQSAGRLGYLHPAVFNIVNIMHSLNL